MKFTLQEMKNLILVATEFEKWIQNGKKEKIEIVEEIPINLWNVFRFYLLRTCDKNTQLALPPQKIISSGFLYGTFGKVLISKRTEQILSGAFFNAKIFELAVPQNVILQNGAANPRTAVYVRKTKDDENPQSQNAPSVAGLSNTTSESNALLQIFNKPNNFFPGKRSALAPGRIASDFYDAANYVCENNAFFEKAKISAAFTANSRAKNLFEIKMECEKNMYAKGRVFLYKKESLFIEIDENNFYENIKKFRNTFGSPAGDLFADDVLVFDTGIDILNEGEWPNIKSYRCYAFIFQIETGFEFVCMPLKAYAFFNGRQAFKIPFALERWIEYLAKKCATADAARLQAIKDMEAANRKAIEQMELGKKKAEILKKMGI